MATVLTAHFARTFPVHDPSHPLGEIVSLLPQIDHHPQIERALGAALIPGADQGAKRVFFEAFSEVLVLGVLIGFGETNRQRSILPLILSAIHSLRDPQERTTLLDRCEDFPLFQARAGCEEEFQSGRNRERLRLLFKDEFDHATGFLGHPVLQRWVEEQGGIRGKRILDLTLSGGGFSAYAAHQGAKVTLIVSGPNHQTHLEQYLGGYDPSGVLFMQMPDSLFKIPFDSYDVVAVSLHFLTRGPLSTQNRLLRKMVSQCSPHAILILDERDTHSRGRLDFEYVAPHAGMRAHLERVVPVRVVASDFGSGFSLRKGERVNEYRMCAVAKIRPPEPEGMSVGDSMVEWTGPLPPEDFRFQFNKERRQFRLTACTEGEGEWVFGPNVPYDDQRREIDQLASFRSLSLFDFWFSYLTVLVDESGHTWNPEVSHQADLTLQNLGGKLVLLIMDYVKAFPFFLPQVIPLLHALSEHPRIPFRTRINIDQFLHEMLRKRLDTLRPLLVQPVVTSLDRPSKYIFSMLADRADPEDAELFFSILELPVAKKDFDGGYTVSSSPILNQESMTIPITELDRQQARLRALDALVEIAKKLSAGQKKEEIHRRLLGLFECLLQKLDEEPALWGMLAAYMDALEELEDPHAIPLVQGALAAELRCMGSPQLIKGYFERSATPACWAVQAATRIATAKGNEAHREGVRVWLEHLATGNKYSEAPWVRAEAIKSLGKIQDASALPFLHGCALDRGSDLRFRWAAIWAIGEIADERSIPILVELIDRGEEVETVDAQIVEEAHEALGSLEKCRGELGKVNLSEVPRQIAEAMQHDTSEGVLRAEESLRRFASGRFERLAVLMDVRGNVGQLSAELFCERFDAIQKALPERYWQLLGPIFEQIFGIDGRGRRRIGRSRFQDFLARLRSLQRKDVPFGLDSMKEALAKYEVNRDLMFQVFAHLLLYGNLKEVVYRSGQEMASGLAKMGIGTDRLWNLNRAKDVLQAFRETVPCLSEPDRKWIAGQLYARTGHVLLEFEEYPDRLFPIYADEIAEAFGNSGFAGEVWKPFHFRRSSGVSFALARRDLEYFTWGNRMKDCSALGEHAFWSRASQIVHPFWQELVVYNDGRPVSVLDLGIFQFGWDSEISLVVDAHEGVRDFRHSSDDVEGNAYEAAMRETFALLERLGREMGVEAVLGTGFSGDLRTEEYYSRSFSRTPYHLPVLGIPLTGLFWRGGSEQYVQITSKGGQPLEVQDALDVLEKIIADPPYGTSMRPLHRALQRRNFGEASRLLLADRHYERLREKMTELVYLFARYGSALEDALQNIYGRGVLVALANPYILWQRNPVREFREGRAREEVAFQSQVRMEGLLDGFEGAKSSEERLEWFLSRILVPMSDGLLFHFSDLQKAIVDFACQVDPRLPEELAAVFHERDTETRIRKLQALFLAKGYYLDLGTPGYPEDGKHLGKITHLFLLRGRERPVLVIRCRPILGGYQSFFSPHLGIPVIQALLGYKPAEIRKQLRLSAIHEAEHELHAENHFSPDVQEALTALVEIAAGPNPAECLIETWRQGTREIHWYDDLKKRRPIEDEHHQGALLILFHLLAEPIFGDPYEIEFPTHESGDPARRFWAGPPHVIATIDRGEFKRRSDLLLDVMEEGRLSADRIREIARCIYERISGKAFHPEFFDELDFEVFHPETLREMLKISHPDLVWEGL